MLEQHIIELTNAVRDLTTVLQGQAQGAFIRAELKATVAEAQEGAAHNETTKLVEVKPVAETPAPAPVPAAAAPSPALTYEAVRDKLQSVLNKGGHPAVAAILKECGVERVPHLKTPEQWAQAYELAVKVLA